MTTAELEVKMRFDDYLCLEKVAHQHGMSPGELAGLIIKDWMDRIKCKCTPHTLVCEGCCCGAFQVEMETFALFRNMNYERTSTTVASE